jgi:hypothetical protein
MSGTALPTAGRFRFVASDRTGRPWITLFALRGVHQTGSGSVCGWAIAAMERATLGDISGVVPNILRVESHGMPSQ